MRKKLRPGDTFKYAVGGDEYDIRVLSVGDRIDAEDILAEAREDKSATSHYRAWLKVVDTNVTGESVRNKLTPDELGDLLEAVLRGNEPSEDELKN